MDTILNYDIDQLKGVMLKFNQPAFRAKTLFKWLHSGAEFSEMSDMPLALRTLLAENFVAMPVNICEELVSKDKSVKLLYKLTDGNIIEGVFMPHSYGNTLCVSTQVGCRMGCEFCASGIGGLIRNLSAGEILGQVIVANKLTKLDKTRSITNIVLMGSGEPLDNYENVTKFFKLINAEGGLNISMRNISLSTCGLVDKIRQLADDNFSVTLSLSLHATTDEAREKIMPIAKKYKLNQVIDAVKYYFNKTGRRVIYEYSMIKGINMDFFDAKRLAEITKGYPCHVNLIKLNPVKEKNISGCTAQEAERFCKRLNEMGISATIRTSFGNDVGGACGQLRRGYLEDKR